MSNLEKKRDGKRVLARLGARELTPEQVERIAGAGPQHTNVITLNPATGHRDGDGSL